MSRLIHLNLPYSEIKEVLEDLYQISYKYNGVENLIEQLERLNNIEEPLCINCHYNINNNCPIKDVAGENYQCSYYERGK